MQWRHHTVTLFPQACFRQCGTSQRPIFQHHNRGDSPVLCRSFKHVLQVLPLSAVKDPNKAVAGKAARKMEDQLFQPVGSFDQFGLAEGKLPAKLGILQVKYPCCPVP